MRVEKLVELKERMDEILSTYVARIAEDSEEKKGVNIINPPADIYLDDNRQIVFIETPEMDLTTVEIKIEKNTVIFKAEKKRSQSKERKYLHMERSAGSYLKVIPLSFDQSFVENNEYTYKYGVVKIVIYKKSGAN